MRLNAAPWELSAIISAGDPKRTFDHGSNYQQFIPISRVDDDIILVTCAQ